MCYAVKYMIYIILRSPPYLVPELNDLLKAGSLPFCRKAGCFPLLLQLGMFGICVSLRQMSGDIRCSAIKYWHWKITEKSVDSRSAESKVQIFSAVFRGFVKITARRERTVRACPEEDQKNDPRNGTCSL